MANPIIIFWQWINPMSKRKKRSYASIREWIKRNSISLMKLALALAVLIPVSVYYVKCFEIPEYSTVIEISRLTNGTGHPYSISDISIVHDYSIKGTIHEEGVWVTTHIDKKNKNKEPLPYLSKEQLKSYRHSDLTKTLEFLKQEHSESELNWDSVRHVYELSISRNILRPFSPYFKLFLQKGNFTSGIISNHYTEEFDTEGMHNIIYDPEEKCGSWAFYDKNVVYKDKKVTLSTWFLGENLYKPLSPSTNLTNRATGFRYRFWEMAVDVSRAVEHFRFSSPMGIGTSERIGSLRFYYRGLTEFSSVSPVPDEITMNSIVFTDSIKLAQIRYEGLEFHTKFPEMENKQQARMFAVTTVLTLLVTLVLKLIYDLTIDLWTWLRKYHKKTLYTIFSIAFVVPIVYLLLCMCFDIHFVQYY